MKTLILAITLGLCAPAFAQSTTSDENATQPSATQPATPAEGADRSAASGSSAARSDTFTHGESARCAKLAGAEKDLCDKEEATKSQGSNAEDLSKSAEPRQTPSR